MLSVCNRRTNDPYHCRAETHGVERRQQAQHQRKHEFDPDLARALFRLLPSFGPQDIRVCPEGLRDARPEPVGLNQDSDERSHLVETSAFRKVMECLQSRFAARISVATILSS